MVKNSCTPSNIFGGYDQTLFLGCSVMSFTSSVGWNEQVSEVSVDLVNDSCVADKIYFDESLNQQTHNGADPGFFGLNNNIIGTPVYFRIGDFEFGGLVQSWTESHSDSAFPTYNVKIVDPRQILEGAQVIIGEYNGSINGVPNLFNVFGYMEQTAPCGFGGARANDGGMPWNLIKTGIGVLTSSLVPLAGNYSNGRLQYRDGLNGGYGLIPGSGDYMLDISEVPNGPNYYRLAGTTMSILDILSQVCSDSGCDYFVEMLIVGGVKYIKVRVVSRVVQPSLNAIEDFISENTFYTNKISGRELRNEVTNTFVVGGKQQIIYEADNSIMLPFWGLDVNGNAISTSFDDDGYMEFEANSSGVQPLLVGGASFPASVTINEQELQAALGGFDRWGAYAASKNTDTVSAITANFKPAHDIQHLAQGRLSLMETVFGRDVIALNGDGDGLKAHDDKLKNIRIVYDWVLNLAQEYYGRKFMVAVPTVCVKQDEDSGVITTNYEPSDGGWTENPTILQLANPSVLSDFFRLEDQRFQCFVRFDSANNIDFANMPMDTFGYLADAQKLWVKATVEPGFVFGDISTLSSPMVVVTLPQLITAKQQTGDVNKLGQALSKMIEAEGIANSEEKAKEVLGKVGGVVSALRHYNRAIYPNAAAIPFVSNQLTYGPWRAGTLGPVGQVRFEQDESLVPWEYGGSALMNAAGLSKANEGVTNMIVGELGSITVPGYPTITLGGQLVSGGPHVTSISMNFSGSEISTTYTLRTFTPQFGRFSKSNADRIKTIGRQRMQYSRALRYRGL